MLESKEELAPPKVIWEPLKGSQSLVMTCPCNHILYEGTRGPGKTDSQIMFFRKFVGQGYGQFWRGIIFDREYKNLDDLIAKSLRWYPQFFDGARFLSSRADYKWVWPTGEQLLFRQVKKAADYWHYHGQEFPFIGWNELTKYPDDVLYEQMMSCNRSSFLPEKHSPDLEHPLPEMPLVVFSTSNPYGAGHSWVKRRFIDDAPSGKVIRTTTDVFNPRTQQREPVTKTQVRIFGSYKENIYLSPEYIADLESITDENKRKAWLYGDWDVVAGGMFDDVWRSDTHFIEPFTIPKTWTISRAYDYGSSKPFSVGWWAISDGSDVRLKNGSVRSTIKGDVFRIAEWYGSTGKSNVGLRMMVTDVAAGIVQRELKMGIHGKVVPGPADAQIWSVENGNSYAADMAKSVKVNGSVYRGVTWMRSDKRAGSRKTGWEKIRKYLKNGLPQCIVGADGAKIPVPRDKPGLFVFNTCKSFKETFPVLPRDENDPDDIDTDAEDHIADETRYFIMWIGTSARSGTTIGTTY